MLLVQRAAGNVPAASKESDPVASSDLMRHQYQSDLDHAQQRFNALAQVAGREMAKVLKTQYIPPIAVGAAAIGAVANAKFQTKGAIANALLAAAGWGVAIMAGENADLRNAAVAISSGLGSAAASIAAYDKVTTMMSSTTAPAPAAAMVPAAV